MNSTGIQPRRVNVVRIVKASAVGALAFGVFAAPAAADPVPYGTTDQANATATAGSQVDTFSRKLTSSRNRNAECNEPKRWRRRRKRKWSEHQFQHELRAQRAVGPIRELGEWTE